MGAPVSELPYSRPLRWHQTRRFQRRLWIVFALAISPFVIATGCWAVDKVRDAWVSRQNRIALAACEAYVPADGQVVFEVKGGTITRLLAAPPWVEWWPPAKFNQTVFLHGLRDREPPDTARVGQVVAVEIDPRLMHTYDGRTLLDRRVLRISSSGVWGDSTSRSAGSVFSSTRLVILPEDSDHIRVFAGTTEAGDPSEFSFDVEYNGHRQTVRGMLQGGAVAMEPQAGEVMSRPGWYPSVFWVPAGATTAQAQRTRAVADSAGQPSPTVWPLPPWWVVPPQH